VTTDLVASELLAKETTHAPLLKKKCTLAKIHSWMNLPAGGLNRKLSNFIGESCEQRT
jgi:hypothetical protein